MEKEEVNFYHGLGGPKGLLDTFDWLAKDYPQYDSNIIESIAMHRMEQIFKCGYIKCFNLLKNSPCMYNIDYDKNQVYIISDIIFNEDSVENYADWVFLSTSFLINIERAQKDSFRFRLNRDHPSIDHQIIIEKQLPIKYIKAICIPVINRGIWDKVARKSFSLAKYLLERNVQIQMIKKIQQEYGVNIPIIETTTFENLDDVFELESKIRKNSKVNFGNFETFKKLVLAKKL